MSFPVTFAANGIQVFCAVRIKPTSSFNMIEVENLPASTIFAIAPKESLYENVFASSHELLNSLPTGVGPFFCFFTSWFEWCLFHNLRDGFLRM